MDGKLQQIQNEVSTLKLDDSLLFLNHILGVSRGFTKDPALESIISSPQIPVLPHVVRFLGKQLLLHASNFGTRTLDWDGYTRLKEMCIDLDDPIQFDPNWKHADPSGFFERMLAQQIGPQRRNSIQKYGLALGLFRDVGIVHWPKPYDLKADIESKLGMTLDQFMGLGQITFALTAANVNGNKCIGTFTPMLLAEAFRQGISICVPEFWTLYLERVACTRDGFRQVAVMDNYATSNDLFEPFGFNPLRRFPIVELGSSRYLAVDPELVIERVTHGLFYDLFEADRTTFTERFGYAFDQFVGQLLESVCLPERLWSAAVWENENKRSKPSGLKIGDRAYIGDNCTVLFECKSLRPTLALTTYGSDESVVDVAGRIADAVEQLVKHAEGINTGKLNQFAISSNSFVGVVVTYGKFFSVNGPFTRKRIRQTLVDRGLDPIPFVVLSVDELDTVIRLVEIGNDFGELITSLAVDDSFDPLHKYHDQLRDCAVSSFIFTKGDDFLNSIVPLDKRRHSIAAAE